MASTGACLLAAALVLAGCGGDPEEQTLCAVVTRTPVPADEITRFGFSGDELLARVEGTHMAQLTWIPSGFDTRLVATNVTAGKTTLSVRITRAGGVHVVDQEPRVSGVHCWDGVEADVEVEAVSADGALAETARGIVFTESTAWASIDVLLHHPPMGTLRIDAAPASGLRYKSLTLDVEFTVAPPYGGLSLILVDGNGAVHPSTPLPVAGFNL